MAETLPPPPNARTEPGHSREQVHLPQSPPPNPKVKPATSRSTVAQADGGGDGPAPSPMGPPTRPAR